MNRCKSYLRGRGIFVYSGKRCELDKGHDTQHECGGNFLNPYIRLKWGRTK